MVCYFQYGFVFVKNQRFDYKFGPFQNYKLVKYKIQELWRYRFMRRNFGAIKKKL